MFFEVLFGVPFTRIRIVYYSEEQFLQGCVPPANNLTSPWAVVPPTLDALLMEIVGNGRFFVYTVVDSIIRTRDREDTVPRIPPLCTMEDELYDLSTIDLHVDF